MEVITLLKTRSVSRLVRRSSKMVDMTRGASHLHYETSALVTYLLTKTWHSRLVATIERNELHAQYCTASIPGVWHQILILGNLSHSRPHLISTLEYQRTQPSWSQRPRVQAHVYSAALPRQLSLIQLAAPNRDNQVNEWASHAQIGRLISPQPGSCACLVLGVSDA